MPGKSEWANLLRDASAGHNGFSGRTALIDAGAADTNFFNERRTQTGVGQCLAERVGRAGADDNGVVMLRGRHKLSQER
jgi:hypothetical protein